MTSNSPSSLRFVSIAGLKDEDKNIHHRGSLLSEKPTRALTLQVKSVEPLIVPGRLKGSESEGGE